MTAEPWRVAQIAVKRGSGGEGSRGSGYLVTPGRVLTAAHVVAGASAVMIRLDVGRATQIEVEAESWWAARAPHQSTDLAVVVIPASATAGRTCEPALFGQIRDCAAALPGEHFRLPAVQAPETLGSRPGQGIPRLRAGHCAHAGGRQPPPGHPGCLPGRPCPQAAAGRRTVAVGWDVRGGRLGRGPDHRSSDGAPCGRRHRAAGRPQGRPRLRTARGSRSGGARGTAGAASGRRGTGGCCPGPAEPICAVGIPSPGQGHCPGYPFRPRGRAGGVGAVLCKHRPVCVVAGRPMGW